MWLLGSVRDTGMGVVERGVVGKGRVGMELTGLVLESDCVVLECGFTGGLEELLLLVFVNEVTFNNGCVEGVSMGVVTTT